MYSCADEKHAVLVLCDAYKYIITWCLERYGHFDDVILNWHHAYSIDGATHTHTILNYCQCLKLNFIEYPAIHTNYS